MKSAFVVESSGSVQVRQAAGVDGAWWLTAARPPQAQIAGESQGQLGEFVEFVRSNKVVLLEEVATQFGIKTKEAKMRLEALESMGRLTGVMDDRGKFIYVTEEEMGAVVNFIADKGRVSITELAESSHQLIRLGKE